MKGNLTRKEAVDFIINCVPKPSDKDKNAWRDLVNTRITRHFSRLGKAEPFRFSDVLIHARGQYGIAQFTSFPPPEPSIMTGELYGFAFTVEARGIHLPASIEEAHEQISWYASEMNKLQNEIDRLNSYIKLIEPKAKRYEENCMSNANSAKMPRNI